MDNVYVKIDQIKKTIFCTHFLLGFSVYLFNRTEKEKGKYDNNCVQK